MIKESDYLKEFGFTMPLVLPLFNVVLKKPEHIVSKHVVAYPILESCTSWEEASTYIDNMSKPDADYACIEKVFIPMEESDLEGNEEFRLVWPKTEDKRYTLQFRRTVRDCYEYAIKQRDVWKATSVCEYKDIVPTLEIEVVLPPLSDTATDHKGGEK